MTITSRTVGGVILMAAPNIHASHGFTTRHGGTSGGIYESLNLGLNRGDDPASVRENYRRICDAMGIGEDSLVCSLQVHGRHVRTVTRADLGRFYLPTQVEADGLITRERGIALVVHASDCVPMLLHDPVRGAIGAVHAGWRGTVQNIAAAAVRRMSGEFGCSPSDIRAAIGPCISMCCFETGADVADALRAALPDAYESCVLERGGKYMVDLKEANRRQLSDAGVLDISVSDECTSCKCDKYWSHRRTNGLRGSQAAIISL